MGDESCAAGQRETGAAPRVADGAGPGGRREREYPAWPSVGDVRARFASWPEALARAGVRLHGRTRTPDAIVTAPNAWAAHAAARRGSARGNFLADTAMPTTSGPNSVSDSPGARSRLVGEPPIA